jgi:hypothetical protein
MKHVWQAGIAITAFVLALAGASCVSSNQIDSSTGLVDFHLSATSTPVGYPWARMNIGQMKFHPLTPGALGDAFVLFPTATAVNLNNVAATSVPPVQATAQTYVLDPFSAGFELNVLPEQPASLPTQSGLCNGSTLESLRTKDGEQSTIAPACQFTVPRNATASIGVIVDGAGLAALLVSKYDCTTNQYTPPTSAEILPFLQFQCGP